MAKRGRKVKKNKRPPQRPTVQAVAGPKGPDRSLPPVIAKGREFGGFTECLRRGHAKAKKDEGIVIPSAREMQKVLTGPGQSREDHLALTSIDRAQQEPAPRPLLADDVLSLEEARAIYQSVRGS